MDPRSLREVAVRVSSEAAALLRDLACEERYTSRVSGETIRADLESEEYIVDLLRGELGAGLAVVSEERGLEGEPHELVAVVDPLDGSTNYSSCVSWASVSVAFAERMSDGSWSLAAGAVAPVFWGHPISFERGGGCYVGGVRFEPSGEPPSVLSVYVEREDAARAVISLLRELGGGFKVRSLGSSALEISYVALRRIAAFMDLRGKLRNVDVAAAVGIAGECGATVIGEDGRPLRLDFTSVSRVGTVIAYSTPRVGDAIARVLGLPRS